jgi:hypothetical protein
MQPSQARALFAAGFTTVELVGLADEQQVVEALAAGLARRRTAAPKGKAKG